MIDRNKELAVNTVILGIGQLIPKFFSDTFASAINIISYNG